MFGVALSIFSLLLGTAILLFGVGLQGTLLALRADVEGFSVITTSWVMSAYFIGYGIGTYLCPALIRSIGHIRAYSVLATIASAAAISYAVWPYPVMWFALRVVTGLCIVGLFMIIESWLNGLAPASQRGRFFAVYMITTLVAMALGQYLLLLGRIESFELFAISTILLSLALVPIAMTRIRQPVSVETPQLHLITLYRESPLGSVGAFTTGMINGAFWGMGPVFANAIGLDTTGIAHFLSLTILGGALLQWPIGLLSDRYDRRNILTFVSLAGALLAALNYLLSFHAPPLLYLGTFLYGGCAFTLYALCVAHLNDRITPEQTLEASRSMLQLYGAGAVAGPLLAGPLMSHLNNHALPLFFAASHLSLVLFAAYRMRRREAPPLDEQGQFIPLSRTSTVAVELDPRTSSD